MPFEMFVPPKTSRNRGVAAVRLTPKRNLLTLNAAAGELLKDVRYVALMFDEAKRALAFKPTTAEDPNGYAVGKVGSGGNIAATSFAKRYGLAPGQAWNLTLQDGLFVASVNPEPWAA